MRTYQEKRQNLMGAKYFHENSQRKKCMELWIEVWKRAKLEQ